ncbi:hypothetical protein KBZ21_40375, partial [Streptomyces sp. A73]|nr:hypothetical protein [Streptomyces sp. A73]
PQRLQESVPDWIEAVRAVVDDYADASVELAADFYDAERVAARTSRRSSRRSRTSRSRRTPVRGVRLRTGLRARRATATEPQL